MTCKRKLGKQKQLVVSSESSEINRRVADWEQASSSQGNDMEKIKSERGVLSRFWLHIKFPDPMNLSLGAPADRG